jgi:glycosyltransferase involved in cell wall biosynthesis
MTQYAHPLISVLTPVYNGERYLAECIESVRAQTRTDWEYIVVDNCSQDGSADLAERYAAIDARIRVVRCDEFVNVHRSFSRSARLMHPHSRYCKFVCADDWMYPECLERMVSVAERHSTVGVVSSYHLHGKHLGHGGFIPYTDEVVPGKEVIRIKLLENEYLIGSPSQLLYRADLVRRTDPFFDESFWHSDIHAAFRTLLECDLGFVHQVLTYTRLHPEAPIAHVARIRRRPDTSPGATTRFSFRLNTYLPNDIRLLIELGREVLPPEVYRTAVRVWLRRYTWFLMKQYIRPSRFRDAEFHIYHREEISRMEAEAGNDREMRIVLWGLRRLFGPEVPPLHL